ncbi:hypothetical protein [Paenibacillus sp. YN15]|uniref:hypothetical protein n=1 Tax=Paenibacillus sp. YN15 TaxID=1742774 RepID=UPI000DCE34D8|nr:hypothetical protein [Paenibacillus sp. YN15]RAV00566.1 hypothetical protein DQG13_14085 [Paenibacillus sp. YN15]
MSFVLYVIFGAIEIFSVFALMFKVFSLPYREYLKEIGIMSALVTLSSYLLRVYLGIDMIVDMTVSFVMLILFMRYMIRIKLFRAIMISLTYFAYAIINTGTFLIYSLFGLNSDAVINDSSSLAAYAVQFTSSVIAAVVAYLIYKRNLGFSYIIRPPHDTFVKSKISAQEMRVILLVGASFLVFFMTVLLITQNKTFAGFPVVIFLYAALLYLAYKRDMTHDRPY